MVLAKWLRASKDKAQLDLDDSHCAVCSLLKKDFSLHQTPSSGITRLGKPKNFRMAKQPQWGIAPEMYRGWIPAFTTHTGNHSRLALQGPTDIRIWPPKAQRPGHPSLCLSNRSAPQGAACCDGSLTTPTRSPARNCRTDSGRHTRCPPAPRATSTWPAAAQPRGKPRFRGYRLGSSPRPAGFPPYAGRSSSTP